MTTIATAKVSYQIATELRSGALGYTASVVVGVPTPTEGYAVSLPGHEGITEYVAPPANGLTWIHIYAEWIQSYADQHAARLALPNHYLGVWVDGDKLYADVTRVIPDLDTAVREAVKADQLAIYNLGTGEEIKTRPGRRPFLTEEQSKADEILRTIDFSPEDGYTPFSVVGAAEYDGRTDALAPLSREERARLDSGQPIDGSDDLARLVTAAHEASQGDSNDAHISALVDALSEALRVLGREDLTVLSFG